MTHTETLLCVAAKWKPLSDTRMETHSSPARTFSVKLLKCNKTHDTFTADSDTSFVFLVLTFDTRVVTVSVKTHNNGAERIKPKCNNLNEWLI